MTVFKSFVIILLSGLVGTVAGGALGYTLAIVAPAYYRGVFEGGRDPDFDPVAVGLGLGLSQGLIVGLLVGAVVVLAVSWYNARRQAGNHPLWFPPAAHTSGSGTGPSEAFYRSNRPES